MKKKKIRSFCSLFIVLAMMVVILSAGTITSYSLNATKIELTGMDNTVTTLTESVVTETYEFDAGTATLTLKNWTGRQISSNYEFTLKLVGTNTLETTANVPEAIKTYDYWSYPVRVTADSAATLEIKGNYTDNSYSELSPLNVRLILQNNVTLKVNLDIQGAWGVYGLREVYFDGQNSHVNVNVKTTGTAKGVLNVSYDYSGDKLASISGNTVNVVAESTGERESIGINGLKIANDTEATVKAVSGYTAPEKAKAIATLDTSKLTTGKITVNSGIVSVPNGNDCTIGENLRANVTSWKWSYYPDEYYYPYVLTNAEGEPITAIVLEGVNPAPTDLTWEPGNLPLFGEMKVGEMMTGAPIALAVKGLTDGTADVSVIGGTLPPGMEYLPGWGSFRGIPTEEAPAGSVTVRIADSKNPTKYIDKTISYDEVVEDKYMTVFPA